MSLRKPIVFLACLLSGATALAQTPAAAPAKDPRIGQIISQLEAVRAPRQTAISPNSNWVAWVVRAEEGRGSVIEAAPVSNPSSTFQVTACAEGKQGEENEIAWSPDSKTLAFFSDCNSEHQQGLYLEEPAAKTPARRLTTFHGYADSPQWSSDGKFIGLLYVEGATRPSGALAAMKPPAGVIGVEGLEIQRVAVVDTASGDLSQITPANLHVYEFNWSRDSKKLAYIAAQPPGENNWWVAKLYTQPFMPGTKPFAGGRATFDPSIVVDPTTGHSPVFGLQLAVPRWSPDGSQIAFIAGLMSDQGSTGGDLYVVPATGGEPINMTPGQTATTSWISWPRPGEIQYSAIRGGSSEFNTLVLDRPTDTVKQHTVLNFQFPANIGDGRLMMSLSDGGGDFAFIKSSFSEAPEVWVARDVDGECAKDCYEFQQITHYNDNLKPSWGKSESVTWKNDGYDVQGWLLYPANYDPAKKYPLIVMVHGGPSAAATPHWPGAGFGAAPFSALGYFVLEPNPRGSYGQGEKFTQANRKDFGYGDLRDILAGVHTVANKYSVDPERVGITGWSYGGFMTMFAVTQTNRFRAAVAGAGIANWQSYYGENSIDQWMIPFFGASVYDDPAVYAKSSAINFIHKVKTPTLVVVGDRDGECPMPQSFEFWHALRDQHVPTQLVVYPNEGHHFVSRDHQRDVLERALSWFEQYMPAQ
ncbi:S9 family peptidase [Alloacidobacterium dinghuense]|uniref:S9 family peptidase n=1 Tax=Alloacidobacterium dinghuense TaxID=2763107 RepID=A0A7G8BEK5_9BACT|nr:S9 family peptidase [Alloacidobacterium dinghuense]QNI30975.1 S9 family peptidase [Alloacidobacterium dinghuense]